MLKEGWKNSIREKNKMKKTDEAMIDLQMIRMSKYEVLNVSDKMFVDYCLALFNSRKVENKKIANYYLNELINLITIEGKENYEIEYYRALWLNVNVNYDNMANDVIVQTMLEISNYYERNNDYVSALSAIANIYSINNNGDTVLELLEKMLSSNKYVEKDVLNSFLIDLKKLDESLYIKGKIIINNYLQMRIAN